MYFVTRGFWTRKVFIMYQPVIELLDEVLLYGDINFELTFSTRTDYVFPYIVRYDKKYVTFHYLYSTEQIIIPASYIAISYGIKRYGKPLMNINDPIEKFTSYLCYINYIGESNHLNSNVQEGLRKIIILGTKEFRKHIKEKTGIELEPIELKNNRESIYI